MRTFSATALILPFALLSSAVLLLAGCAEPKYESTDDFLENLSIEKKAGDIDIGTMPSIDGPMGDVAKIRVETETFDVGVIAHDALAHKRLKIYNDGGLPLKITKIDTTCACTQGTVTPDNSLIQGGKEAWIDVVIDPRRIPGFHSEKVLSIVSTDPARPVVEVKVIAQVDPEYDFGPDEIELGDIPKGKVYEKRLRFRQLIERTVNVTELKILLPAGYNSGDSAVTSSVEDVPEGEWKTPGRQEFELVFTFAANMPAGPFTRYATLITNIKRANRHRITFTGTVIAPYAVTPIYPEYAALEPAKDGSGYHARFTFSAAMPIEIKGISTGSDQLVATASPGTSPNEVFVDVTYSGTPPKILMFDEVLVVEVQVNGETFTEDIGVFLKPGKVR
ncbi:MAG: DUF1573 domain-containing protein [Candidatus Hydrogenedentes bacterium]|nr:DUF1573 domain-containing protein [Candidatus Hydrogenedentota bacterium]